MENWSSVLKESCCKYWSLSEISKLLLYSATVASLNLNKLQGAKFCKSKLWVMLVFSDEPTTLHFTYLPTEVFRFWK